MAKVYTIEPNPHWVIIDNFSKLPNGAAIYTYSNRNPSVFKPAFQDASGLIPYGEYIPGFGNGTMPPIYWEFDDTLPDEGYYIRVYDKPVTEPGSNFLWDFDDLFGGGSGGGGGGTVTTFVDIENLVVNGEFYNNCGNLTSIATNQILAPSNHSGFSGLPNDVNDSPVGSDIIFAKSNITASDSISFVTVSPLGLQNLGDNPTPEIYVNYTCSIGGSAEAYKCFQFPLVAGVQNTSEQEMGVKIFARLNSGTNNVTLRFRQFFGNGDNSPSADVLTSIGGGPLSLVQGSWVALTFSNQQVPSVVGKTLGNCGNDALYLQLQMPPSPDLVNIDFILPAVYLGGVPSKLDFHTEDEVNAIANSPRTGDTRTTINNVNLGWVRMNDKTIGNATSGSTARANIDTFPLFKLIWDNFSTNQALAPMYTSGGVSIAYGASAVQDFAISRRLSLTKNLGRVMIGALPEAGSQAFTRAGNTLVVTSAEGFYTGMAVTVSGGGLPSPLVAGTVYFAVVLSSTTISLATTVANALAVIPVVITLTTAGTGTLFSVNNEILGAYAGEELHPLTVTEMPAHTHAYNTLTNPGGVVIQGGTDYLLVSTNTGTTGGAGSSTSAGSGAAVIPHNTMQPYVGMNIFIKL